MKKRLSALLGFTCLSLFGAHIAQAALDWEQDQKLGLDVSISHGGEKWQVGNDGKAYRWVNNAWKQHGSRSEFIRIDASDDGAAAITKNGYVYLTSNNISTWRSTGIRAKDIGIGGDKIWLAGVQNAEGKTVTLRGDFSVKEEIKWDPVEGALEYIDTDPLGRAWGTDKNGAVYVHTEDTGWIKDTQAPKASDIGAGGNGALYIVEKDMDHTLGGGRVHQRDPQSGEWQEMKGRLSAITVTPEGQAFGVNSLNWVIAGNMQGIEGENTISTTPPEIDPNVVVEGDKTLADIVGNVIPGADKVKLAGYKFTADPETAEGWVELNGSPVHAILYTAEQKDPIIALEHESVDLGTYIPKIRNTSLGSFGLANAVFFILPDQTEEQSFDSLDDVPEQLKTFLKKGDYEGLFPLELKPGVTAIGLYSPASDGNAAHVMRAFNMDEKGYAVKGHFTVEQLKNPSLAFKHHTSGAKENLTIDKAELCKAAIEKIPVSGLDLKFPLPDYTPSGSEKSINFHDTQFTLKEIDGEIEPAIISGLTLKLKKQQAGISELDLAGKLAVQGSLDIVCDGVSTQTDGQISLAAAQSFNVKNIENLAFDALSKLVETGHEDPDEHSAEGEAETNSEEKQDTKKTDKKKPEWGWENPYGAPYIKLKSLAVKGEFKQKKDDEDKLERSLSLETYSNAKFDRADIEALGQLSFDIKDNSTLEVSDWGFQIPSSVALNDLPIAKDVPYLDEFSFANIDVGPNEMVGTLGWGAQALSGQAYLRIAEAENDQEKQNPKATFIGRFDTLKPSHLLLPYMRDVSLPDFVENAALSPAIIGFSNEDRSEWSSAEMPDKAKPLFQGLLGEEDSLTLASGLTLAGITSPEKIFSGKYGDIVTDYFAFGDSLTLTGAFERDAQKKEVHGSFTADLNNFALKQIPETILSFKNSVLEISDLENQVLEVGTDADLKLPGLDTAVSLTGKIQYEAQSDKKNSLKVELSSTAAWDKPFNIPELKIENIGFEANYERNDDKRTQSAAITGDGTFRGQTGEVTISFEHKNGNMEEIVVSFEGSVLLSKLFAELPNKVTSLTDLELSKLLISTNAIAGDMTIMIGDKSISGRGAVIQDGGKKALFVRNDNQITVNELVGNIPPPLDGLYLPKGVFIIGSQAVSDFDAHDIPKQIYDDIFGGLVDDERIMSLNVADGVMYLTLIDADNLPSKLKTVLSGVFGLSGEVPVAASFGGIFGGTPSFGFFTSIKDAAPSLPEFVNPFIEFKDTDLDVFVHSQAGGNAIDLGLSTKALVKARRIDDPSVVQSLDTTFSLTYNVSENNTSILVGAAVDDEWVDPLGLEGYTLNKPSIKFGQKANGTTLEIHTDRAEFIENGQTKAFLFDLATTWAGAVPTDLAVQFAKVCLEDDTIPGQEEKPCEDLVLTPISLARIQQSIFDLTFRAGSSLKNAVIEGLKQAPTEGNAELAAIKSNAPTLINGLADGINTAKDGMFTLIENSPLSMIGVRNPVIYFGTPGSVPPYHPDVERPPLGFGLHVAGDFLLDVGSLEADLAKGVYKVNLLDGYMVKGEVTPPAPFSQNFITVSGNMPFLGGAQHLRFDGRLEVPGVSLPGGIGLSIDGRFDVTQGSIFDQSASIAADVTIGGILSREGSMTLANKVLTFNSPAECTDIPPLDLNGSINVSSITPANLTESLLSAFRISPPDPVACMKNIGEAFKEIAEAGVDLVKNPVGTGEAIVDEAKDLLTNPADVAKKAKSLAKLPLDTADLAANIGISVLKTGVDKVPVLGPGAGKVLGEGFNKANELKNYAMNQLANNAVTGWVSDSLGVAVGSIGGAVGSAVGTVGGWLSGGSSSPTWYRINPLRCKPGYHHWNPIFTQCFENGAVVLFDESSRQQNKLGDCIRYDYDLGKQMWVDKCHGDTKNQFHLDPVTNRIKTTHYSYNGYNGHWVGPGQERCMYRSPDDSVKYGSCNTYANYKWTYTEDLKLQNGDKCVTRGSDNKLVMAACSSATKWLGTSIAPNWNEALEVPVRGRITHKETGRCLYWLAGGPYHLASCSKGNVTPDDKLNMRTHARIHVLDNDHNVALMGARPWDGAVHYGCMGLVSGNTSEKRVMARHCWPDTIYTESKWTILAVKGNNRLDHGRTISLKDTLRKYDYVFYNLLSGQCLKGGLTDQERKNADSLAALNETGSCTKWNGGVSESVKFRGYEPDNLAQWVMINAQGKEEDAWKAERERIKPNLQQWQRYRIRAENARIDSILKATQTFKRDVSKILSGRTSPGQCAHEFYWNQNLKKCAREEKMVLLYHDAQGTQKGCMRYDSGVQNNLKVFQYCNTTNEHQNFLNAIHFRFNDTGHVLAAIQSNGNELCLTKDNSKMPVKTPDPRNSAKTLSLTRAGFKYCSEHSLKWGYTPNGELVSSDGRCLREVMKETKSYNLIAAREMDKKIRESNKVIYNRFQKEYAQNIRNRDNAMAAFRAPIMADGKVTPEESGRLSVEYDRLNEVHRINEMNTRMGQARYDAKMKIQKEYNLYETSTESTLVLAPCDMEPMEAGKRRWVPSLGKDLTKMQGLPQTARIKLANDNSQCLTTDMRLNGNVNWQTCAADNLNQYFAFGGTDHHRFVISPRNSKTCIYNAGDGELAHRPCTAGGSELFLRQSNDNGEEKLINAQSTQCLSANGNIAAQVDCDNAGNLVFEVIDDISRLSFARNDALEIDPQRTEDAQKLWDNTKTRATWMYMGAYLQHSGLTFAKNDNDAPIMHTPKTEKLESIKSHINPVTHKIEYIPEVIVPRTNIITIPGFNDGQDHISFAHAIEMQDANRQPVSNTDPYKPTYGNWWVRAHLQKVLRVNDSGGLSFDYIDESDAFRKSATFKVIPALSGEEGKYSFQSVLHPHKYLIHQNGALTLGGANASLGSFNFESTAKWYVNEELNLITMEPPFRAPRPPYKDWKFPDTATSILNKNY